MANNLAPENASSHKKRGSQDDKSLVVYFGEMLIDFVPTVGGVSLAEAPAFEKAPGGAPANVAVRVARLGGSAGFIGKVPDEAVTKCTACGVRFWGFIDLKEAV